MKRKAEVKGPIEMMFIALILLAFAGAGMWAFYQGMADNYGVEISDEGSFSYYEDTFNDTSSQIEDLSQSIGEGNGVDVITVMLTDGFGILTNILLGPPKIFIGLITQTADVLGLPPSMAAMLYTLIVVVLLFAIIAIIMKVRS